MTAPAATTFQFRQQRDLEILAWPLLDGLGAEVMVTTRHGGVSSGPYASLNLGLHVDDSAEDVLENRRRVAAALDADLGDFVFCKQAHGRDVRIVTTADRGKGALSQDDAIQDTDALITQDPGTVLVVMVADCVPIVLYDPAAQVLACIHAGWRGTVVRVAEAALEAMASLGARPENVLAGVGPAIAPDRYQVGKEVADEADRCFGGDTAGIVRPDGSGRWLFNLWAANHRILTEAGVPDDQIQVAALPTGPAQGSFFSDRAARPCGRFAAVARLMPQDSS
jgi:YfiH family protein